MPDEDPSGNSSAADNASIPKKETVRINIPPKQEETPLVKRETVRINTPGTAPKKETTSLGGATPLPAVPAPVPPPAATRPLVPPPSAPPPRPPASPNLPGLGARPAVPPPSAPRPGIPAGAPAPKAAAYAETKPVSIKAAPKKETARIQVAPTQKLPQQSTVRLNQPGGSLTPAAAPALRTTAAPALDESEAGPDKIVVALSWVSVAFSLVAAALSAWAWNT
jgi:hypothetical protein